MKYFHVFILMGYFSLNFLHGQSPYTFNPDLEPRLTMGSLLLNSGVSILQRDIRPLELDEIMTYDARTINGLDRIATRNWRPKVSQISDLALATSVALPLALGLDNGISNHYNDISLLWLETLSINYLATSLAKILFRRKRPYTYHPNLEIRRDINESEVARRNARLSFFSGHTSTAASMSFMFAQSYNDFYPDKNARYGVWAGAALFPAAVGFMRVHAGKHYPTDVIVGYIVGAAVGILVPRLHK